MLYNRPEVSLPPLPHFVSGLPNRMLDCDQHNIKTNCLPEIIFLKNFRQVQINCLLNAPLLLICMVLQLLCHNEISLFFSRLLRNETVCFNSEFIVSQIESFLLSPKK